MILCGTYIDLVKKRKETLAGLDELMGKLSNTFGRSFNSIHFYVLSTTTGDNMEAMRAALNVQIRPFPAVLIPRK